MGLRGWQAQIPGLIYVGSAYYLISAYGRGDWPELIATSSRRRGCRRPVPREDRRDARPAQASAHAGAVVTSHRQPRDHPGMGCHVPARRSRSSPGFAFKGSFRCFASEAGVDLEVLAARSVGVGLWWLLPAFIYSVRVDRPALRLGPVTGGGSPNRVAEIFDPLRSNNLGPPPLFAISHGTRRCRSSRRCGPRLRWRSAGARWGRCLAADRGGLVW